MCVCAYRKLNQLQMVLSVCVWLMVWTCAWGVWLGLRGPTQFCCCSLSSVVVSPAPFSDSTEGGDGCDLEEKVAATAGWGFGGVWLQGGGVACGSVWLGLRLEDGAVEVVCGRAARPPGGTDFTGGVASGSGVRVPGGVTGGNVTDQSKRI